MEPAKGYEIFVDQSYYDMWAARPIGCKDFYQTIHFWSRDEACRWTHFDYTYEER